MGAPGYPYAKPPRKPSAARIVLIVLATLFVICGGGCGAIGLIAMWGNSIDEDDQSASTVEVPPVEVPLYRLDAADAPDLAVYIDELYTVEQMTAIVNELQEQYAGTNDGYWVYINCIEGDNRLANAQFADGPMGAARTGLRDGEHVLRVIEGKKCPPDPLPAAAPGAVTAQQVVDAIVAAGLPVREPRDNSGGMCQDAGCSQLITTDDFSVYQFPDVESATKWASIFPLKYQNQTIVMRYTQGGSEPTDPTLIPQYNAVVDGLMG